LNVGALRARRRARTRLGLPRDEGKGLNGNPFSISDRE
jgi:hypothetical protein